MGGVLGIVPYVHHPWEGMLGIVHPLVHTQGGMLGIVHPEVLEPERHPEARAITILWEKRET